MNDTFNATYDEYDSGSESILYKSINNQADLSISNALAELRISALTKAAEMSPHVKEATIGPNSPLKKEMVNDIKERKIFEEENNPYEDLTQDKLSNDLRYTLIMKEYEAQLQQCSEVLFRNLFEKILTKRAETMNLYFKKQSEQCERRAMEYRTKKVQLQKELQENDNLSILEWAKLDEENNSAKINRQTIDNINRILEEQNKATARFASITDSHTKICICYNEITNILNTEPLARKVCDKYIPPIYTVVGNINVIMDLCKNATVTDKEVKQAEILSSNINNIKNKLMEDLNEMKHQELIQKQKEEEEIKLRELQNQKEAAVLKETEITQTSNIMPVQIKSEAVKPIFYSSKNYTYYKDLSNYLDLYEAQYKGLSDDARMKKFRFDCQKAVNTPVNALSSVSAAHMKDKFEKLSKLLNGNSVKVLDIYVTASEHPQGLAYCTALLAKKIVRQGELLVSSNPEAAFPLAAVTVALWSQFPEFGKLLEAYFHKQCPYLVPMFLPQKENQTDKEFYLSRGYTYSEDGVVEKQDKFLKRMSGIFRLRCAIWITKMPKFMNAPNPHGIKYGWQWLASFLNLKPEPDISATLLHDFFTVCGSECNKLYGTQFTKVIQLICTQYLPILQNIDEGGPKTRLEVFLQSILKNGQISTPSGIISNSW